MWTHIAFFVATALPGGAVQQYQYVENTTAYVAVQRGKIVLRGKLDRAGNFVRDCGIPPLRLGQPESPGIPDKLINDRRPGRIHVYEYRSGRLIKGELDADGNFVPDVRSSVIDFKDYHFSKSALIIYNLPGWFTPKK